MTHTAEIDALAYVVARVPNFIVPEHSDLLTALVDRVGSAWDEGYKTGYSYRGPLGEGTGNPVPDNPYANVDADARTLSIGDNHGLEAVWDGDREYVIDDRVGS